jgi:cystathionine beta-lyase
MSAKKTAIQTHLAQPSFNKLAGKTPVFNSLAESVHRASTIVFDTVHALRHRECYDPAQFTYGLLGTPTTRQLENQLAKIDGVDFAILTPSGLSAISCIFLALLKSGDEILLPYNSYGPALIVAKMLQSQFGVQYRLYDPSLPCNIIFKPNTRLIWVETPGSVTIEVADLSAIAKHSHAHNILVGVDATWTAGIALDVFKHGADISIQALTKYQSGGSDVLMGAITTHSKSLHKTIHETVVNLGVGVSPEDCRLILRSLPHYGLRYHAQDQAARHIAQALVDHPTILQVLHPAIPSSPGHAIWARDFTASASLFSVIFKPHISQLQIDACVESLKLFHLGYSWGGATSLVVPFTRDQMHENYAYAGLLVRFYIGLEDEADLQQDVLAALNTLS